MNTTTTSSVVNSTAAINFTEDKKVALYFTVDFINEKICGKEINFKYAGTPGTSQYKELMAIRATHPGFGLNPIKPKKVKQTYAGLNKELMREYIMIQEAHEEVLAQFEKQVQDNVHTSTIKSWFLDLYKGFDVKRAVNQIKAFNLATTKRKYAVKVVAKSASNSTLTLPKAGNQ
jgi:hypothetical protein